MIVSFISRKKDNNGTTNTEIFNVLAFTGKAEKAMNFYTSPFPDATIDSLTLYEEGQPMGDAGTVLNGTMNIYGQQALFMDMPKVLDSLSLS